MGCLVDAKECGKSCFFHRCTTESLNMSLTPLKVGFTLLTFIEASVQMMLTLSRMQLMKTDLLANSRFVVTHCLLLSCFYYSTSHTFGHALLLLFSTCQVNSNNIIRTMKEHMEIWELCNLIRTNVLFGTSSEQLLQFRALTPTSEINIKRVLMYATHLLIIN